MDWFVGVKSGIETVLDKLSCQIAVEVSFEGLYSGVVEAALTSAFVLGKNPFHCFVPYATFAFAFDFFCCSNSVSIPSASLTTSGTVIEFPTCLYA